MSRVLDDHFYEFRELVGWVPRKTTVFSRMRAPVLLFFSKSLLKDYKTKIPRGLAVKANTDVF